ncbi:hypothetical protein MNBD_BACTEROID03-1967 [hydrothermal vent metagenome]|uniref:Uncharacterized protein n=1 Tax=hydrothermal vent metagenome TaxID=652676 RepID=A0A3B0TG44_9ZZZZ
MAEQIQPNTPQPSDEIDLGQLLEMAGRGLKKLGNVFLRLFIYLKKSAFILIGLIALGVALNFLLNSFVPKKLKTDVIVRPNFESTNYLYDVVDEISSNISTKNESFFNDMGIQLADLKGFGIEIEAIEDAEEKNGDALIEEMKYLEVLQNFKDESFVIDILKSELFQKSIVEHKITFSYKDPKKGTVAVEKMLEYINGNPYFDDLRKVHAKNAKSRIESNLGLIDQVDKLITNYTNSLLVQKDNSSGSSVYLEKENEFTSLLELKNDLIKEIEEKKVEILNQANVLNIINLGKSQKLKKPFFNKRIVATPTYLVLAFFLFSIFGYINRKAKEIE